MFNKIVEQITKAKPEYIGLENIVEKEVLHFDILAVLKEKGFLNKLTFMGGTSLRLCYGAERLSEDLDFTGGSNFRKEDFFGLAKLLSTQLSNKYGVKVIANEPQFSLKDTSTWKMSLEKYPNRPDLPMQKVHLDVCKYDSLDVQKRPLIMHYGIETPISHVLIPVQSMEEILADKMIAFAYRERRIKPRDVWDIYWLKQQGQKQNSNFIKKKLSMRGKTIEDFLKKIMKHAKSFKIEEYVKKDFLQEMSRFLPFEIQSKSIQQEDFYEYLSVLIFEECVKLEKELGIL